VEGRVTCNDGGFPARGAKVNLWSLAALGIGGGSGKAPAREEIVHLEAATDFDGYYLFPSVPPGDYVVVGRLAGYSKDFDILQQVLSRFAPAKQKELLTAFPQVVVRSTSAVRQDLVLRRGAAISGRVTFDSGGALAGAFVEATLVSGNLIDNAEGGSAPKPVNFWMARQTTDDRGVYRLAGLSEGKYRIEVQAGEFESSTGIGSLTVFAPESLTAAESSLVAVGEGDEVSGVDITVPLRLLHSIGGTITRGGIPISWASLIIQRQGQRGNIEAVSGPGGTYRVDLLQPDTYILEASYAPAGTESHGSPARRKITVLLGNSDVLDANIDLPNR